MIYNIKIWFVVLFFRIKRLLGFKFKTDEILNGQYCYVFDGTSGINKKTGYTWYGTKTCPYYKTLYKNKSACLYLGFFGWDLCLNDQCKICGVKNEIDEKDLS
jgi:hypothetical protein